jgi:integrase/transposase
MGRPLTGSIVQISPNSWEVSVPERRGATKRIRRYFDTLEAAEAWRVVACQALTDDVAVPEPKAAEHWFVTLCNEWHHRVYRLERRAGPGRKDAVRGFLDREILPFFTSKWATPTDVHIDACHHFVQMLAGLKTTEGEETEDLGIEVWAIRPRYQTSFIAVLEEVLDEAVARRIVAHNPAAHLKSVAPAPWAKLRQRAEHSEPCTLAYAKELASAFHILHQLVLWLQRIVGLRISEAFGIEIGDVMPDGDTGGGWVLIADQGGGEFLKWNELGKVEKSNRAGRVKTKQSYRVACVPPALMRLIELFIDIYHRDVDGNVDPDQPLIPGIYKLEGSRQSYTSALKKQSLIADGDYLCSHDLRKAMVTDLTHFTGVKAEVRRLLVGHLAGGDVHDRVYNGQTLDRSSLRDARDEIQALIDAEIGTLMTPTTRVVSFGTGHPMRQWMDRAQSILTERGLLIGEHTGISTEEAGERLGRTPQVVRRYLESGLLRGRKVKLATGGLRWIVDENSIEEFIAGYFDKLTYADLEEATDMTYHQVYEMAKKLRIQPEHDEATRRDLFTFEQRDQLLKHLAMRQCMLARSMTVEAAAQHLRRRRSTIQTWIGKGLDLDAEASAVLGTKQLTRESVTRVDLELRSVVLRNRRLPGVGFELNWPGFCIRSSEVQW